MSNNRNGTLYIGVTGNLVQRVFLHREGCIEGFTKRYACRRLVYFEWHEAMPEAIAREKHLKHWRRKWKLELIHQFNPDWRDLYPEIVG
jgi:putative endonuclease